MGALSRRKGHDYERQICRELKKMGFLNCKTSRNGDRSQDAAGVDLLGTEPFKIQCKAVEHALNYSDILTAMPKGERYNVIFHKRNRQQIIVLQKKDFYELLEMLIRNQIINI